MSKPDLTVIVTTFNEQETIENCVRRIFAVYPESCEVLVVDGGFDQTGEIVRGLIEEYPGLRYIYNENDRGKGHAVLTGIDVAQADVMAQIDADLQFLPEELPRLIEPILSGRADVTLGSRFTPQSVSRPGSTPFVRTWGNKTTSLYASLLTWRRMTDILAGMKAWTRDAVNVINLKCENCSYDAEISFKASLKRLRVVDVPITTDVRQGGQSQIHVFVDGMRILRDITLFRLGLK